jgi:hypothetical protein
MVVEVVGVRVSVCVGGLVCPCVCGRSCSDSESLFHNIARHARDTLSRALCVYSRTMCVPSWKAPSNARTHTAHARFPRPCMARWAHARQPASPPYCACACRSSRERERERQERAGGAVGKTKDGWFAKRRGRGEGAAAPPPHIRTCVVRVCVCVCVRATKWPRALATLQRLHLNTSLPLPPTLSARLPPTPRSSD